MDSIRTHTVQKRAKLKKKENKKGVQKISTFSQALLHHSCCLMHMEAASRANSVLLNKKEEKKHI